MEKTEKRKISLDVPKDLLEEFDLKLSQNYPGVNRSLAIIQCMRGFLGKEVQFK